MNILVVGASKGLGRAFIEGLANAGDTVIGVSRSKPHDVQVAQTIDLHWIEADMSSPKNAVAKILEELPVCPDVVIYNLGIWEQAAFSSRYDFLNDRDDDIIDLINTNITGAILLLKHVLIRMRGLKKPHIILTGSTSGLSHSGRPEVTFTASKFALNGIADALREGFRQDRLAVTCLQLGYLNTEDDLSVAGATAALRGEGTLIPVHDVVAMVKAILSLSSASFVRELVLPALLDDRF